MTDASMNFQDRAPKIPPRILCIGMPVRDLTFRVPGVPARGSKANADHFERDLRRQRAQCRDRDRAARRPRLALRSDGRRAGDREPLHLRADGARRHRDQAPRAHAGPGDADLGDHDRPDRRAHHRHLPRSRTVEGEAAAGRHAAGRLRRGPDREPLRGILHRPLRRGAAARHSRDRRCRPRDVAAAKACSRPPRIWCSPASRCRRRPARATKARR